MELVGMVNEELWEKLKGDGGVKVIKEKHGCDRREVNNGQSEIQQKWTVSPDG